MFLKRRSPRPIENIESAGLAAGDATEMLHAEAKVSQSDRGKKKGFHAFIALKIAEGLRGEELAKAIQERKERERAQRRGEKGAQGEVGEDPSRGKRAT